jgi:SAM-dependent methyltransferase
MGKMVASTEEGPAPAFDPYRSYDYTKGQASRDRAPALLFARKFLVPALTGLSGRPIVELGAGTGSTLLALRHLGFDRVQGCDASPSQLALATAVGAGVELADGLAYLASLPRASLGAVVALDVLEHLEEEQLRDWLLMARSRLGPGSVMVARVPNGEGLFGGAIRYGDLTHRRAFTAASMRQVLGPAGFDLIDCRPCRPIPHGLPSALRSAVWAVVETGLRVASFSETGSWRDSIFTRNLVVTARIFA